MRKITNIGIEPWQRHTILLKNKEITLELRFHSLVEMWTMDVSYDGRSSKGVKIACRVLQFRNENWPFGFYAIDADNSGIDPFKTDDFASNRVELYLVMPDEMAEIRGVEVEQ